MVDGPGKQSSVHLQKHENRRRLERLCRRRSFHRTCGAKSSYTFKKKPFRKEYASAQRRKQEFLPFGYVKAPTHVNFAVSFNRSGPFVLIPRIGCDVQA